jgi:hypothetical protein
MPTIRCQYLSALRTDCHLQSRNGLTDTNTCPMYVYAAVSRCLPLSPCTGGRGAVAGGSTHVYLAILEALLQILVDSLVRDLANQREIRNSDFLLLGGLEDGLLRELRLGLSCGGILLAPCALRYGLYRELVSTCRGVLGGSKLGGLPWLMPNCEVKMCLESADEGVVWVLNANAAGYGADSECECTICEERSRSSVGVEDRQAAFDMYIRGPSSAR